MTNTGTRVSDAEVPKLEIRYHNAMPNWAKLVGLKVRAVHECEGGGFMIDKAQAEAIIAALTAASIAREDEGRSWKPDL